MAEYVSVAEARKQSGMRIVLGQGIPGPWAEGIRGILDVKKIPYTRGLFEIGSDHAALIAWTAQASAPAIAWNDELPKSNWAEQLYLAERIHPEPSLIPANQAERINMFGYANELCGMHGFGWSRRLMMVHQGLSTPDLPAEQRAFFQAFGTKYGYSPEGRRSSSRSGDRNLERPEQVAWRAAGTGPSLFYWRRAFSFGHLLGRLFPSD